MNSLLVAQRVFTFEASQTYLWQFILFGIIGLGLLLVAMLLVAGIWKAELQKIEKIKYGFTIFFDIIVVCAIVYWQMYQFWAL